MWGSIIRCLLQGYLVMALSAFNSMETFANIGFINQITAIAMLLITIGAPLWSAFFMRMFKTNLNEEDFKKKFEVLYQR